MPPVVLPNDISALLAMIFYGAAIVLLVTTFIKNPTNMPIILIQSFWVGVNGREAAQGHLTRRHSPFLADVTRLSHVDRGLAAAAGLRVTRGQRRGKALGLAWQRIELVGVADHHVRAGLTGDVEPEVSRRGQFERQHVVVACRTPHEDCHAVRRGCYVGHRTAMPDSGVRIDRPWRIFS